jgi:hypothetical protein
MLVGRANQLRSMDFVVDMLLDWRRFRELTVVDSYTHDCSIIEVDSSLARAKVVEVL